MWSCCCCCGDEAGGSGGVARCSGREGPEEKKLLLLSEKREAAAAAERENCCGNGRDEEGSEDDERDEGGVGRGDSSCGISPVQDTGMGDVELGGGEGGMMGVSNEGGGVVEADEVQLSCAEDGDDVTTGLTLWFTISTPRPLLELLLLPLVLLLLLLLLLLTVLQLLLALLPLLLLALLDLSLSLSLFPFLLLLLCSSVSVCFVEPLLLSPLLPLDFLLSLVAIAWREGHASPESGSGVRAAAGCSFGAVFSLPPPNAERLLELEVVFPEVAGCGVGIGLLLLFFSDEDIPK